MEAVRQNNKSIMNGFPDFPKENLKIFNLTENLNKSGIKMGHFDNIEEIITSIIGNICNIYIYI